MSGSDGDLQVSSSFHIAITSPLDGLRIPVVVGMSLHGGYKHTYKNFLSSCIHPSCGTTAMHSVSGAYCNGCTYERLVEELGFGYDSATDTLMGSYNGEFFVVTKDRNGYWIFPFELAISEHMPPKWENNRRSAWERTKSSRKKIYEDRKASKMTLPRASEDFLTKVVEVEITSFFEKLTPNHLWNASKGALRPKGSKLRNLSLHANGEYCLCMCYVLMLCCIILLNHPNIIQRMPWFPHGKV